ncbi:MarR family winged helix-turn-helix transcriptional regulator [Rhodococcus sp. MEB064]|uniref:MarR family winged helix-turn-helix transcriptional regulator n=1 Tax=Rhodococcus sp. MEB064 TaxID=1587522 RepID=UPI0005AC1CAF|nr:MarR family transcriptional regulator [Rhodococcus sp. MEB064]KIQ20338.1 MarR family transcriptional regulator [Rhodococcus sp. MEB064]
MHSHEKDLGELVMMVARSMRRRHMAALEPFGLSPSHGRALRVLAGTDDALRPGDLAERLRIAPRSATDVVDALESSGWVARSVDATDRRAVLLRLTDDGRDMARTIARAQKSASEAMFAGLGAEDRATLAELLTRINDESGAGNIA